MAQLFFLSGRAWTDSSGNPYPAAVAHFYVVGTTTGQDTYTSASLATPNANPVVSDASTGIFPEIHFAAKRYKCVIKDASANTLQTFEVIDATSQLIAAASAPSPTYPFLRYHNTSDGHIYRRNAADNAWIDEGAVDSLLNAATVTEQLTGTATDKSSTPDSVAAVWQRGANITPSGGVVSLPSGGGGVFNVAAGNFSAISSAVGGRTVKFIHGGTSVITHHSTSMICLGGASVTTEAGDISEWTNEAATDASGSNWRMTDYNRDGVTLGPIIDYAASKSEMETGTTLIKWVPPGRIQNASGVAKAFVNFTTRGTNGAATMNISYNVDSVSRTASGVYLVTFTTDFSSANYVVCPTSKAAIGSNLLTTYDNPAVGTCEIIQQSASAGTATNTGDITVAFYGDQ